MKKRVLLVLLAMVLVVSLVAFAACAKEEEEEPEVWQWPERILLGSTSTRSPLYGAMVGWSTPLSQDIGVPIRIVVVSVPELYQRYTKEGRFFSTAPHQMRECLYAAVIRASRDGGPWLSSLWMPAGLAYWGGVTQGDSGIKTPYDIKPGMSAIMMTIGEEPQQFIYGLLAWAQVDPEDITWIPIGSTSAIHRPIMDRKADFSIGYHTQQIWYEAEASPCGLTWIELDAEKDPEGAQRFLDWFPYTGFGRAKGGVPSAEDVPMLATITPWITSFETDPELVYRIVKWTDENYDKFKDSHPWAAAMTIDNLMGLAEEFYEPIHDGAVRYLEEKGLWTEELEARRQYNVEQLTLWVEAYQTAIGMADDRGITVDPGNEEWTELWVNYRESLNLPLLVLFQGPGKEQPRYSSFYDRWNRVKPFQD